MKIQHIALRLALIATGCASLNGCLNSTPTWDRTFGNSIHSVTAMQTLNPNAAANEDPVAGVDGTAATAAQQNYGKSFLTPPPPVDVLTIGVGHSSGAGN